MLYIAAHKASRIAQILLLSLHVVHTTAAMAFVDEKSPSPPHLYVNIGILKSITTTETQNLTSWLQLPTPAEALGEAAELFRLSSPIALNALLIYSRSAFSMLFLGLLGELPLAAGSLAISFANITGYSVLAGLSLGAEPLCSQASGAARHDLLSLTLIRSVLFLLCSSIPLSLLWLNMSTILLLLGQDREVTALAQTYLLFTLPDLISFSFIHPIRVYLRSKGVPRPLAITAAASAALHLPLVLLLRPFGVPGVAAASSAANLALLLFLLPYLRLITQNATWRECITGWGPLVRLAGPSCASVCLEWWWYELMTLLCGLLPKPRPAVASMGVLIQTTALLYIFPSSLGLGASARVGNELGANRPAQARRAAYTSILVSMMMGVTAVGFSAVLREKWGAMFTRDAGVLQLVAAAMPVVGLCELGNCPQTVGAGVLRGSARPAHAARVNLGAFYLLGAPVALVLAFGLSLGLVGLWMGLLAAQLCCAGLMLYIVGATDWEGQAQQAQALTSSGEGELMREMEQERAVDSDQNDKINLLATVDIKHGCPI